MFRYSLVNEYRQTKFGASANIDIVSHQENHLMPAEVDIVTGGLKSGISPAIILMKLEKAMMSNRLM